MTKIAPTQTQQSSRWLGKVAILATSVACAAGSVAQAANVIDTGSLVIAPTGKLDLANNALIVRNGNTATLSGYLGTGINLSGGGWWDGFGIQSSVAALTAADNTKGVGGIPNDFEGSPITAIFQGVAVNQTDFLAMYTWEGDADLDGFITPTDYFLIDNGFINSLTGWLNGDFDYSGSIDPTDYFLIDNSLASGGAPPPSPAAAASPVPEPGSVALLALGMLGLFGARRRVSAE